MDEPHSRLVVMGRVLGPFGVKGWIKIQPYTERPGSLAQYPAWWMLMAQGWREFQPEESEQHGRHLVARMRGFADRDEAARFSGAEIAVSRDALPEAGAGEFYRSDLVDLKVVNLTGEELGRVKELFDNGAHDILRVVWVDGERVDGERAGGERLLPFIATVVKEIDMDAGEIRVDWGADW